MDKRNKGHHKWNRAAVPTGRTCQLCRKEIFDIYDDGVIVYQGYIVCHREPCRKSFDKRRAIYWTQEPAFDSMRS